MFACIGMPCTYGMIIVGSNQPAVPADGVIVRWRLGSGDAGKQVRLRALVHAGNNTYVGAGTGVARTTAIGVNVYENERLPVRKGQFLGADDSDGSLLFTDSAPGVVNRFWFDGLADGGPPRPHDGFVDERELQLNAELEPDADGDG